MRLFNLYDGDLVVDDEPAGYGAPYARVGRALGAEHLAGTLVVLHDGQAICPYHYEVPQEEWLLVLEGRPLVRTPAGEEALAPGDLICFPRGPEGAHKVANARPEPARVLIVSDRAECAAAVYEDSDKVGVFAPELRMLFRRSDQRDYWDGEPDPGGGRS
jgi:uncharacterized cupin superfamily protein